MTGLISEVRSDPVGLLELRGYVTVAATATVSEVVQELRRHDCSTALVTDAGRLAGIFTERDVLHKVVGAPDSWDRPVRDYMTPEPVTVGPEVPVIGALRLMNEGYIRDLPVTDARGRILGSLTDNAVVRHLCGKLPAEVMNLPPNPDQVPRSAEGA
jgi:CBS domain-containing protein